VNIKGMLTLWHYIGAWLVGQKSRIDFRSDKGAAAVEFGLMVALIAAVIIDVVGVLGTQIQAAFQTVCTAIKGSAC
jgi:pilus assembly protein Flp/PilA